MNPRMFPRLALWLLALALLTPLAACSAGEGRLVVHTASGDYPFTVEVVDTPEKRAEGENFMDALGQALAELPYRQRACWLLREVEGMTHPEIGKIMTLSAGAVRGQLTRAGATLSERLAEWQ